MQTLCNVYTNPKTEFSSGVYTVTKEEYIFPPTGQPQPFNYFSYTVNITPASGFASTPYTIVIFDILTGDELARYSTVGTQLLGTGSFDSPSNPMNTGDTKKVTCKIICSVAFQFGANVTVGQSFLNPTPSPGETCQFNSASTTIAVTIDNIEPTEQVPDIKVLDFLKGVFKMFNLTAFLNSDDEIVVKTLNDFYDDSTTTHNLTEYVEKNQHTVGEALPFSSISFNFPEPKTKLAQAFLNINNLEYGRLDFIADASQSNKYEILSPFGHMLYERLSDVTSGVNTAVQYGLSVDSDDNSVVGSPLLFYGIYNTSISTPINYVDSTRPVTSISGITNTTINNYWMPHNANELGTTSTAPAFNLNYGSEINSYTLTDYGGNNNSLFQKFYQSYIQRVFNTKTRIFKFKAVLPLKFLLTYTLADKVFISGKAYTINKITTDLQTGRSTLELLNEPS